MKKGQSINEAIALRIEKLASEMNVDNIRSETFRKEMEAQRAGLTTAARIVRETYISIRELEEHIHCRVEVVETYMSYEEWYEAEQDLQTLCLFSMGLEARLSKLRIQYQEASERLNL